MSAPQTNLETQKRRHRGPLIGMIVVVAFALIGLFFLMMNTAEEGTPVESEQGSIDGRTGLPTDGSAPADLAPAVPAPAPTPKPAPAIQP